ncbi:50S ribosomal protein L25/general stress protein Ctc [Salipaludibacillus agaradhaerens]|uniref:50S ribosomal protein L25/general stress protein Ctc n=1 Tax=Salipaludibacillus agaradhaerens TaxID=76935 RepID=UPI0021518A5C|nr:50S ribosomal protein L25/general stress protein Ctc [Salipaludibacillus agaradhaerens]MCR6104754.1 50S ribosomal protein L25/general stress protein Ctc [Salipaludibacillus agaradhaerens]MCR6116802.1 50S ribosomal protein L25/general stress protein Ctc [Salipaludibacillus agaradhaerens]UJW55997.1 50S ribosomal protein L25/general stress protein Ctc [Bacillus sp. A116_S68]
MATVLQAAVREDFRGSRLSKIRQAGNIPAVVYGKAFGNKAVAVEEVAFIKTLRSQGKTGVFKLDIDGTQTDVMIYDMQYDSIKNEYLHIDFYAADMTSEMDADVPVHVIGESKGVKDGGVLQQAVYELSVRALPADLPDGIEVDVTDLDVNDTLLVKDLKSGANFEFNSEPEEVVVSILPPDEEPEEPAVDEGREPELVDGDPNAEAEKSGSDEEKQE